MLGPSTVLLAAVLSAMILVHLSGYYRRSLMEATVCSVIAVGWAWRTGYKNNNTCRTGLV